MQTLTEEQKAIADHGKGPALVFAVAGSGKTHTMVYRIKNLVEKSIFNPDQILATTFNTNAVQVIKDRLQQFASCKGVKARTLNSLGNEILRQIYTQHKMIQEDKYRDLVERTCWDLKSKYRSEGRVDWAVSINEVNIDDLVSWINQCKGNLMYPDLKPWMIECSQATLAKAPPASPWFNDVFREVENKLFRTSQYTFADQLKLGWECLHQNSTLCETYRKKYQCVIVDEFQDLNLAQAEMLHLLACEHKNYMAIGDDDQTIYEWRGASPDFIGSFENRYNAKKYIISDNFRCNASPIALANKVIAENRNREEKHLSLTRKFQSGLFTFIEKDSYESARSIVDHLEELHNKEGIPWSDMSILMRVFSQSAPFEILFNERDIPFCIQGSLSFFESKTVRTLKAYLYLTYIEQLLQDGKSSDFIDPLELNTSILTCINKPPRFATKTVKEDLQRSVLRGYPLSQSLRHITGSMGYKGQMLKQWAWEIQDLAEKLKDPDLNGQEIIKLTANVMNYDEYLKNQEALSNITENQETVNILGMTLQGCRSIKECLDFIKKEQQNSTMMHDDNGDKVLLTTIFRAKGLEWPVVVIPNLNEGYYPHPLSENIEEERRLLYVALTRSSNHLLLGSDSSVKFSRFLKVSDLKEIHSDIHHMENLWHITAEEWTAKDTWRFADSVEKYSLFRYLGAWALSNNHFAENDQILKVLEKVVQLYGLLSISLPNEWEEMNPYIGMEFEFSDLEELKELLAAPKEKPPEEVVIPAVEPESLEEQNQVFCSVGDPVEHPAFGRGTVKEITTHGNDRKLHVYFSSKGNKVIVESIGKKIGMTVG